MLKVLLKNKLFVSLVDIVPGSGNYKQVFPHMHVLFRSRARPVCGADPCVTGRPRPPPAPARSECQPGTVGPNRARAAPARVVGVRGQTAGPPRPRDSGPTVAGGSSRVPSVVRVWRVLACAVHGGPGRRARLSAPLTAPLTAERPAAEGKAAAQGRAAGGGSRGAPGPQASRPLRASPLLAFRARAQVRERGDRATTAQTGWGKRRWRVRYARRGRRGGRASRARG